jgi:hypothetical protein
MSARDFRAHIANCPLGFVARYVTRYVPEQDHEDATAELIKYIGKVKKQPKTPPVPPKRQMPRADARTRQDALRG